jgi:hypothetical protein
MSFRFDRAAEEQFLNKPVILDLALLTVDFAKKHYADRYYRDREISLRVRWAPTEEFRAGAYVTGEGNHEIRLSYGTAIEIYRDAFVLPETCRRVLVNEAFDPIFNLLSYGNDRNDVLPAGLTPESAKIEIIRLMTIWLFLHEQAHLLQRHGEVAKAAGIAELLSNDTGIEDAAVVGQQLAGRDAAMRHAFEFAADAEAITHLMMVESIGGMSEGKLWCLTVGLMCMFRRFYGTSSAIVAETPQGSHPHPGMRMRMTMNRMEQIAALPDVGTAAKWTKGPAHARAVMDHAVYAADVFWHLRYLGVDARTPFLDVVVSTLKVPPTYQQAVFEAWQSVRAEIVAGHLGFGEGAVMFLREPAVVGARAAPVVPV